MRTIPCTFFMALLCCLANLPLLANNGTTTHAYPPEKNFDVTTVKLRLEMMACPVEAKYNKDVAAYLRRYLTYGVADTKRMLGNGQLYFPIFEHYLEIHDLPKELKYLPMVESSMIPYAVSYAGAAGLWQFMPATGRYLGLINDKYIDERKDPYRSTEAAVKYLKKLHKRFGSWELALAAYNCGPGRLNRTVRAYNSRDFWKIKNGLPRETQRYVSKFIAACYIGTYHQMHGLYPTPPALFYQRPLAARIYAPVSLKTISSATGVGVEILRKLNPSFKLDSTPGRSNGIFLVLPKEAWYDYLDVKDREMKGVAARP